MSTGIQLVVPGVAFENNNVGFIPPVADGLEYMNLFVNGSNPTRNLAPGKPSAVSVGDPLISSNALISTVGLKYLQTSVPESSQQTYMVVAAPDIDFVGSQQLISNFGNSRGFTLRFLSSVAGVYNNSLYSLTSGGAEESSRLQIFNGARIIVARRNFGVEQEMQDAGGAAENDLTGLTPTLGDVDIRIGSSNTATAFDNETPIYAAAIWSRAITDVEVQVMFEYLAKYCAAKGIALA